MKTKESVIKTRSNGLKHFDKAAAKSGRNFILTETVKIAKKFPGVDGGGWSTVAWAAANAVIDIIDKGVQQSWNLDEAFTETEMEFLAKELSLKMEDYKPIWDRKKSPSLSSSTSGSTTTGSTTTGSTHQRVYFKFNIPGFDMVLDIPQSQWLELTQGNTIGEPLTSETVDQEVLHEILFDESQKDLLPGLSQNEINKLTKIDVKFI